MRYGWLITFMMFSLGAHAKTTELGQIKKSLIQLYPKQKIKSVSIIKRYGDEYYIKVRTNKFCHKRFVKKTVSKAKKSFFYALEETQVERCAR